VALEGGRRGSDQNSDGSPVLAAGERRGKARGVSKTWFAQDLGGRLGRRASSAAAAGVVCPVPARPAPGRGKARQGQLQGRLRVLLGL
jgi:hypothetical protein